MTTNNHRTNTRNSRLILIGGGGGGGTGKTTFAVALLDYFRKNGIEVVAYDAETEPKPKGRLKCYVPDATLINIHAHSSLNDAAVAAVNEKRLTVIDLGAGTGEELLAWLEKIISAFRSRNVPMTLVCPLTSAPQTLQCVIRWSNHLGHDVDYLLGLVDRDEAGFSHLEKEAGVQFLAEYKPAIITLRHRNPDIYSKLEGRDLSPGRALELFHLAEQGDVAASEALGDLDNAILMAEIESDLNHLFAEFDRVIDLLIPKGSDHAPTQPS